MESKLWSYWFFITLIVLRQILLKESALQVQQLHEENLIDRSGKDEADKVGCGQIIKDLEFHTKETKGNASLRRVIT